MTFAPDERKGESRKQKAESRKQKAESRKQKPLTRSPFDKALFDILTHNTKHWVTINTLQTYLIIITIMTNTIQIFENEEFGAIRTMIDEQGETWFCGQGWTTRTR